jgi:hypothetical protein
MRWFKHTISVLLLVSAAGVALATALSNHNDDYGQVQLPQGGIVHLPAGTTTVFFRELGDGSDPIRQLQNPLSFQVVPLGGGAAISMAAVNGGTPGTAVNRSETIGELGAVAKLEVPSTGSYEVSGSSGLAPGSSFLEFGTNPADAVLHRWKLLVGLVLAAILIGFIPTPKPRRRWEEERGPSGWSSDSRAPYAG